jgi:hypothetical protein
MPCDAISIGDIKSGNGVARLRHLRILEVGGFEPSLLAMADQQVTEFLDNIEKALPSCSTITRPAASPKNGHPAATAAP